MKIVIQIFFVIFLTGCGVNQQPKHPEFPIVTNQKSIDFKTEIQKFNKINELIEGKINFIVYKDYYIGSTRIIRSDDPNNCPNCYYDYSNFLIWKVENVGYIQRFDNCGNYFPIVIENSEVLSFMEQNFKIIKSEKIKFYQVDEKSFSMVSHSRFKEFFIFSNQEEYYNFFDVYNLSSDSEKPNINYSYNQQLKIIQLNYLIEDEIKTLESSNSFKRDLSTCK